MNDRNILKSAKKYSPKGRKILRISKIRCYGAETDFYHNHEIMKEYIFRICFVNLGKVYSVIIHRLYNFLGCNAVKSGRSLLTFGRNISIFRAKE
jgi:hypothetical protein